jgi:hypothetical protein
MKFEFNRHQIKAITIKQPYASLIINGIKDVENRTWNKKIYKNVCKNWLFVHSSAKLLPKKELIKLTNFYKGLETPTSSIIGMMHINSIGNASDSVHKTIWAYGPKCWYIDAVIKFKEPILTTGKLGQWDPDSKLHSQLQKQITASMYNIIPIDDIDFVKEDNIYYATQRGKYMTWKTVIHSLIKKFDTFTYKLIQCLLNVEYTAYFWECDQVNMEKPFRFAIFNSKKLAERKQDNNAFKGVINCKKNVIAFPSLSKQINLVVPCKRSQSAEYTSLATFSQTAPIKQQVSFWKKVGENIKNGDWVSTSGLGVSWLHVRISPRPTYYHNEFNTKKEKEGTVKIDEYLEDFYFPKFFVNIIVIEKSWKIENQKDLITYYLQLLPKNTKVIIIEKEMEDKALEIGLDSEIYLTNWKKHGRFGKKERNKRMLDQKVDLVTVFGNGEENLIKQSKEKGFNILII